MNDHDRRNQVQLLNYLLLQSGYMKSELALKLGISLELLNAMLDISSNENLINDPEIKRKLNRICTDIY